MSELFLRLVNLSISAGWLVLCVMLVRLALQKAPKWIRPVLWGLVALRLVLPSSVESALSLIPSAETISPDILYSRTPAIHSDIPAVNSVVNPVLGGSLAPSGLVSANPLQIWVYVASIVWLAGIAVLLLYAAVSFLRLRKRVGASLNVRDKVWVCNDIKTPFILGIFRPRIYLPSGMEAETEAHVLAHENAHLRRRDHWWKPLGFLLLCVYWFNPVLWAAYILLCRDIELACDESVIRALGRDGRADYSEALLACSVPQRKMVMACPLAFGEVGVKERVKNVLNYKKPAFWIVVVAVVACVVVAVCFLTNPKEKTDPYMIDDETWEMSVIVAMENDQASIVACSEAQKNIYPDANTASLQCTAKNGTIVLTDASKTWEGSYTKKAARSDSTVYDVVFLNQDEENGSAVVSYTKYSDGSTVRTLVLSCGRYTIYFYKKADDAADNSLSINDVITLSGKGEELTWSDFDAYAYTETGFGLYIRVYEIDEQFSLMIGGGPTDEPPMYIRLVSKANSDDYIDVRTEDVSAFIAQRQNTASTATVGGVDEPAQTAQNADPLDVAVSAAILDYYGSQSKMHTGGSEFACESHVTLSTVSATPMAGQTTHEVIVYAMVLYQEYDLTATGIEEVTGSHVPTVLTFAVNADGTHTLSEYWTPRDGGYYAPDIREKFPAHIVSDALDTQKYILAQTQSCYAQAVVYGKVDTAAVIGRLLDVITSSPRVSSNPGDYIDAHPIEYRELSYYGDYTLRYVFGEFLKGGQTDLRGHIMRSIMDDLIGGEALKLEASTGQEYFDAWRAHTERIWEQKGDAYMQENCPKGWLLLEMPGK